MLASMKKGCKFAPRYEPIKHTTMKDYKTGTTESNLLT